MKEIIRLVEKFRTAIDLAKEAGKLDDDFNFCRFPNGCCGDTCYLLGQFLLDNNIQTRYVCGMHKGSNQSHAWLMSDANTIIDITGDQFRDKADFLNYNREVYVGVLDSFHELFEVEERNIHKMVPLSSLNMAYPERLKNLYKVIKSYF